MGKLKLVLTFGILVILIIGGVYWIGNKGEEENLKRIELVNKNYKFSKGVIIELHSYKGHSVEIDYSIKDVEYKYSGRWNNNPNRLSVGDSVNFKYSVIDPSMIITELEDEYLMPK